MIRIKTLGQQTGGLCFQQTLRAATRKLGAGVPLAMKWDGNGSDLTTTPLATRWEMEDTRALAKGIELSEAAIVFTMERIGETQEQIIARLLATIEDQEDLIELRDRHIKRLKAQAKKLKAS